MCGPGFLQCDFHTHTEFSGEDQSRGFTIAKLFETADELNMRYVGYTEHWHTATHPDLFLRIRDEVERLQPRFRAKVFVSAEIDALNSKGDLSVDPVKAAGVLDYVSVAISHYGAAGAEQLKRDRVEDTVAMIEAVCRIPEVTMLMHPQIVYGRSLAEFDRAIAPDIYAGVIRTIGQSGKVVDYPSVSMSESWLTRLGYGPEKMAIARESFTNFTKALVDRKAWVSPGSDAHNVLYADGSQWFGNNRASYELLQANGYGEDRLWYFENHGKSQAPG